MIWKESNLEIVDEVISEAKIICKAYKRAIFIKQVVLKSSIKDAALFVGIHPNTGSEWLRRFNEEGIDGLFPKYGGGRPSFLSDDELDKLKYLLKAENENYSIKDAKKLIYDEFGVEYSYKQVWEISQRIIMDPCDPPKRIIKNGKKFRTNGYRHTRC